MSNLLANQLVKHFSLCKKEWALSFENPCQLFLLTMVFLLWHKSFYCSKYEKKSLTNLLHDFGECSSYDEAILFKHSAAVAVAAGANNVTFQGNSIIHCSAENFDCEVSSQICKKPCHSRAMVLGQTEKPNESWLGAEQATNHCLNQCCRNLLTHICVARLHWANSISL